MARPEPEPVPGGGFNLDTELPAPPPVEPEEVLRPKESWCLFFRAVRTCIHTTTLALIRIAMVIDQMLHRLQGLASS